MVAENEKVLNELEERAKGRREMYRAWSSKTPKMDGEVSAGVG